MLHNLDWARSQDEDDWRLRRQDAGRRASDRVSERVNTATHAHTHRLWNWDLATSVWSSRTAPITVSNRKCRLCCTVCHGPSLRTNAGEAYPKPEPEDGRFLRWHMYVHHAGRRSSELLNTIHDHEVGHCTFTRTCVPHECSSHAQKHVPAGLHKT